MRSPVHLQQTVNCGNAMIDNSGDKDSECVESETHLTTRHNSVDAVVQKSYHVDERHEEGAPADDGGTVVDKIEEFYVIWLVAHLGIVHIFSHVGDDKDTQVVHLCGNAKWVD